MQSLSQGYASADSQTQASSTSQYDVLAQDIMNIVGSATYQGKSLLWSQGPLTTINLTPDSNNALGQLSVNLGQIIGPVGDNYTAWENLGTQHGQTIADVGPAITTAISDAQAFISSVGAYQSAIQSHLNVTNSTMQNLQSFNSTLTNIDTAQVMTTYTQQEILQQAGAAILSQANMDQRNVLLLYQFPTNSM
jgi:flagellin